jgi:hypothetical protein
MPTQTRSPQDRLREWIRLNDQALADEAREAIESDSDFKSAVMAVNRSQFRALHNTAKMCGTVGELRTFVRKRAERRTAAGKEGKAAFWESLLSALSTLKEEQAELALEACDVPEADSTSIRNETFDRRTAHILIARRFVEHLAMHAQYLNANE